MMKDFCAWVANGIAWTKSATTHWRSTRIFTDSGKHSVLNQQKNVRQMATIFSRNPGRFKPEAKFKRAGLAWLRQRFGKHFFHLAIAGGPYQASGSPDCICSIRGVFVAIEWKAPKEETGRKPIVGHKQRAMIDAITAAGGLAGVVSCWEELEQLVADIEPVQASAFDRKRRAPGAGS
jgi:hypothetical protein